MRVNLVSVARCLIKVHETGRWAHINVKLLHYSSHTSEKNGHILKLYILPTDNSDSAGVKCTLKTPAQIPLPGMRSPFKDDKNPYLVWHSYLGEICVLPSSRQQIKGFGLWSIQKEHLELESASPSVKDIDAVFTRLGFLYSWSFADRQDDKHVQHINNLLLDEYNQFGNYWDRADDLLHYSDSPFIKKDNNEVANLIASKLADDKSKQECFQEFQKIFSLSCLYTEHKICKSLHQQGIHDFKKCLLCKRISQVEDSREMKNVSNEDRNNTKMSREVLLKAELLFDMKAIGYNIHGSCLVVNGKTYVDSVRWDSYQRNNRMKAVDIYDQIVHYRRRAQVKNAPFYAAIEGGYVSWIKAFIAIGVELKDFPAGELVKHTLEHGRTETLTILKILLGNGVVLAQDTYPMLYDQAPRAIEQNDYDFLQRLIDLGLKKERDLMPLIDIASGISLHKCLKVRVSAS